MKNKLFFKIKPFASLSRLAELRCIIIVSFCLSTDPKIKLLINIHYKKTAKSQTVDHLYQHCPAKTPQC